MLIHPAYKTPVLVLLAAIVVLAAVAGHAYGLVPEWHPAGIPLIADDTVVSGVILSLAGILLSGIRLAQCRAGRAIVIDNDGLTNQLRLFGAAHVPWNDIRGLLAYQGWFGDELVVSTRLRKIRLRWLSISKEQQASIERRSKELSKIDWPQGSLGEKLSRKQ